jgi:hypothetical protein
LQAGKRFFFVALEVSARSRAPNTTATNVWIILVKDTDRRSAKGDAASWKAIEPGPAAGMGGACGLAQARPRATGNSPHCPSAPRWEGQQRRCPPPTPPAAPRLTWVYLGLLGVLQVATRVPLSFRLLGEWQCGSTRCSTSQCQWNRRCTRRLFLCCSHCPLGWCDCASQRLLPPSSSLFCLLLWFRWSRLGRTGA